MSDQKQLSLSFELNGQTYTLERFKKESDGKYQARLAKWLMPIVTRLLAAQPTEFSSKELVAKSWRIKDDESQNDFCQRVALEFYEELISVLDSIFEEPE